MFDKYDPGFLAAFIGLVMSVGLGYSYRWIKILYRFSKLFTKLDELVKSNENSRELVELVELVEEARKAPWFRFIRRYQIGKRMDELISAKKAHDLKEIIIGLSQPGGANQVIDQAVAEAGDAEENSLTAGLRRRVGIQKIVLRLTMEDEGCEKIAIEAVARVGVDPITINRKEGTITVIGEADPVWLAKLRKMGFKAELVSVVPAKEEKKEEKKTEAPASCTIS